MPRLSSLVLAVSLPLAACSPDDGGSNSVTTEVSTSDSQPTGGAFTPDGGDYELTPGVNSGSCAADNLQQYAVHFGFASVTTEDGGFSLAFGDSPGDGYVVDCTLSDQDFTCSGNAEFEAFVQTGPPDARAAVSYALAGRWTAADAFELTITGTLACTGDPVGCGETATDWGVEMPCDMINVHKAK